jgi:hypothetical protein
MSSLSPSAKALASSFLNRDENEKSFIRNLLKEQNESGLNPN